MKKHLFVLALLAAYLSSGAASAGRLHARAARSVMPSLSNAKTLLNTTTRHREWVNVATVSSPMLAFVVYPERADRAPVVLVTVRNEPASAASVARTSHS